eukprot:15096385-Alexandrium_andersonii.AAC.1
MKVTTLPSPSLSTHTSGAVGRGRIPGGARASLQSPGPLLLSSVGCACAQGRKSGTLGFLVAPG